MKILIEAIAVIAIISAALIWIVGCGTDRDQLPTTLEADPKTGEVSVKGDKGDRGDRGEQGPKGDAGERGERGERGDTGPQGPKGDTGPAGKDGKDAESATPGIWKDPISGRQWVYIQGKWNWGTAGDKCSSPWRFASFAELSAAVTHGLGRALVPQVAASLERAWTNAASGSNHGTVVILDSADDSNISSGSLVPETQSWRVYCTKD